MAINVSTGTEDVKAALMAAMDSAYDGGESKYEEFAGIIANTVADTILQHIKDNAVAQDGTSGGGDDLDVT